MDLLVRCLCSEELSWIRFQSSIEETGSSMGSGDGTGPGGRRVLNPTFQGIAQGK